MPVRGSIREKSRMRQGDCGGNARTRSERYRREERRVSRATIKASPFESKYFAKPIYAWIRDNYDYLGRNYYADVYRLSEGVGD